MSGSWVLCYRHDVSAILACALYQQFHRAGYRIFLDNPRLDQDQNSPIVLKAISDCSCFVLLLTPGTLNLCVKSTDCLRSEIDTAVKSERRFIILATLDFDDADFQSYLPPDLAQFLQRMPRIKLRHDYIDETIARLRAEGLEPEAVDPVTIYLENQESTILDYYNNKPLVTLKELNAQRYYEQAIATSDPARKVKLYSDAIRLNPLFEQAYFDRALVLLQTGDESAANADYEKAMALNPKFDWKLYSQGTQQQLKSEVVANEATSILGSVEIPLLISLPKIQLSELSGIAEGWINFQGGNWTPDLPSSFLVENVRLKYVAYWIVNCGAQAKWTAKVVSISRGGGLASLLVNTAAGGKKIAGTASARVTNKITSNIHPDETELKCGAPHEKTKIVRVRTSDTANLEIVKPHFPLNKLSADMVRAASIKEVLKTAAEARAKQAGYVTDVQLQMIRYDSAQVQAWLYPIYFGEYHYKGEKLEIQIDAIAGSMYGDLPAEFKH